MRTWIYSLAAACSLLGIVSTTGFTQSAAGTLTGTVTGADGKPKSFAQVRLQGKAIYAAGTDVTGTFTIKDFTTGPYSITIRQNDNTETQSRTITDLTLQLFVHW
jgi:Carboxypeptidase regulatory-like domain